MLEILHFPVFAISQAVFEVYPERATFGIATKYAVKKGYFDEMLLVDSAGKAYRIRGYEVVKAPFWKRPKTILGQRGVQLQNFVLEEVPVTFEEIRERVLGCIEKYPELYDAAGERKKLLRRVRKMSSTSDLFSLY